MHSNGTLPALIFFSDLDGTLLDHTSYDHSAAEPALSLLREHDIPLILASSKTAAEMNPIRQALGFAQCPAIMENGAGLLLSNGSDKSGDGQYRKLTALIDELPQKIGRYFSGFHDWDLAEISRKTGLEPRQAQNAAKRDYSEPGIWSGDEEAFAAFERELAARGIAANRGGRFMTLSFGASKADRMDEIVEHYGRGEEGILTIAFGDAPNDIEMLEKADQGVIVFNPHGVRIPCLGGEDNGKIVRTRLPGPVGWNDAALSILSAHGIVDHGRA